MTARRAAAGWIACMLAACGGSDPAGQLVTTTPEPPGSNCPAGGAAVQLGNDDDGDGELDADEVTDTEYVCNSAATGAVVRVDDEPPGAICAEGGVAVHSGMDDDGDGVLDDAEIDDTAYVCAGDEGAGIDGVVFGDVGIGLASDADRLVGVRRVTGSITIEGAAVTSVDLSTLEEVGGVLSVRASGVTALTAPVLERAAGLSVSDEGADGGIQSVSMPSLRVLAGEVRLFEEELATIDLSALERVGSGNQSGNIRIYSEALVDLDLPSLWYVRDDWQVSIPSVETVSAPVLEAISDLEFVEADALVTVDFSALERAGTVQVSRCAEIVQLDGFPSLREVDGLAIRDNPQLTAISFPALTAASELGVIDNPLLPTCQATALAAQSNATSVTISGNDDDGTCD